ncbi:unnamed protein product [Cyprideis torosa]|uniref:Uncharacterized protein n=1 Tax=Cyprideis torosa TaxID=163714 RepID=A0A7R8ZLR7_9CRUS|nr:unnamed protein product [Cyprideis torosa]CAG0887322.1 unnamed protein product [Cyprideis torosa]
MADLPAPVLVTILVALLGFLSEIPQFSSALSCRPCHMIDHCPTVDLSDCDFGITTNRCGCCPACFKGPGEECGGPFQIMGKCGRGMFCRRQTQGNQQSLGICSPINSSHPHSPKDFSLPKTRANSKRWPRADFSEAPAVFDRDAELLKAPINRNRSDNFVLALSLSLFCLVRFRLCPVICKVLRPERQGIRFNLENFEALLYGDLENFEALLYGDLENFEALLYGDLDGRRFTFREHANGPSPINSSHPHSPKDFSLPKTRANSKRWPRADFSEAPAVFDRDAELRKAPINRNRQWSSQVESSSLVSQQASSLEKEGSLTAKAPVGGQAMCRMSSSYQLMSASSSYHWLHSGSRKGRNPLRKKKESPPPDVPRNAEGFLFLHQNIPLVGYSDEEFQLVFCTKTEHACYVSTPSPALLAHKVPSTPVYASSVLKH